MLDSDNGNGVGIESYGSSSHGMPMSWQSHMSNTCAAPMQRDMDSFAWASVSRSTAVAGDSAASTAMGERPLPPPLPGFKVPQGPAGFEHFQLDSGLLEQAGRSSSCYGGGNGTAIAGAFAPMNETPSADAAAGGCTSGGSDSKKRRRSDEVIGTDQANASADSANETERSNDIEVEEAGQAASATTGKSKAKGAKEAGELPKDSYVHVRARSGQATNRHSIAEKLRREKISERMKVLQDLVPGCSKVTGKAVMLDEIINYVQSLQRQVEFLAMKLSAVNPMLDLNAESLLSKDILRFPWSPSTAPMGYSFSQDMMPRPSQTGMIQGSVHGIANPDVFRTVMEAQLNENDTFREPISQIHHPLNGPFRSAAQLGYPLGISSEGLSVKPDHDGFHM